MPYKNTPDRCACCGRPLDESAVQMGHYVLCPWCMSEINSHEEEGD